MFTSRRLGKGVVIAIGALLLIGSWLFVSMPCACAQMMDPPVRDATVVLLPAGWDHKTQLPVAIWLHGYRSNPSTDLEHHAHYQASADALGIAIVGVPATEQEDQQTFVWARDLQRDSARVEASLHEAERRSGATFGRRMLFGFSQGGLVAAELAARAPERYAGAIALSPGGDPLPEPIAGNAAHRRQRYFISIGAGDLARRVETARHYRDVLGALGAQVTYREVQGMNEHARPADWPEQFRQWAQTLLKAPP